MELSELILEVENAFQEREMFKLKADRREAEIDRLKHTIYQLQVQAADLVKENTSLREKVGGLDREAAGYKRNFQQEVAEVEKLKVQAADLAKLLAERDDELREAKKRLEVPGSQPPSFFVYTIDKQNQEIYNLRGKLERCSALLAGVLTEMRVAPVSQLEQG